MKRRAIIGLIRTIAVVIATSVMGILAVVEADAPKLKKLKPGIVSVTAQVVEDEVVVRYREDLLPPKSNLKNREQVLRNAGKQLSEKYHMNVVGIHVRQGIIRLRIPPGLLPVDAASFFKDEDNVEYASPNYKVFPHSHNSQPPNDTHWLGDNLWGLEKIGMKQAWAMNSTWNSSPASGPIVAVLDTGIDYEHPDLRGNRWKNTAECCWSSTGVPMPNGFDDDQNGYDDDFWGINVIYESSVGVGPNTSCYDALLGETITQTRDPMDIDEHGTSVAGTIAAVGDNDNPMNPRTGFVGVAPKARLMAVKWMCSHPPQSPNALPEVWGDIVHAVDAVEYAIKNKATVINASWGIEGVPLASVQDLRNSILEGKDMALFVTSAGNSQRNLNGPPDSIKMWPQKFELENEIVVAASNPNDGLWDEPDPPCPPVPCTKIGSNYGNTSVDIAAPGENIWTTIPHSRSDFIGVISATSMAAPHVAGCAALLQAHRAVTNPLSTFLPSNLKSELINRAAHAPLLAKKIMNNTLKEAPRLDCYKAITPPPPQSDTTPPEAPQNVRIH
jgi:subtilisin family serine protease